MPTKWKSILFALTHKTLDSVNLQVKLELKISTGLMAWLKILSFIVSIPLMPPVDDIFPPVWVEVSNDDYRREEESGLVFCIDSREEINLNAWWPISAMS